jgi:hypothetical protein
VEKGRNPARNRPTVALLKDKMTTANKVTGLLNKRNPHSVELHNLHSLPYIIKVIKSKYVVHTEKMRIVYKILLRKSERDRSLGRFRRRWGEKILKSILNK